MDCLGSSWSNLDTHVHLFMLHAWTNRGSKWQSCSENYWYRCLAGRSEISWFLKHQDIFRHHQEINVVGSSIIVSGNFCNFGSPHDFHAVQGPWLHPANLVMFGPLCPHVSTFIAPILDVDIGDTFLHFVAIAASLTQKQGPGGGRHHHRSSQCSSEAVTSMFHNVTALSPARKGLLASLIQNVINEATVPDHLRDYPDVRNLKFTK